MDHDPIEWMASARREAVEGLASPGDWLTGAQRLDAWRQARLAFDHPLNRERRAALSPTSVAGRHEAAGNLPAAAVEVVHRVASDPGRLTKAWADSCIAELGPEVYTELVGATAIGRAVDTFAIAVGEAVADPPAPDTGEPHGVRPDDVGDVGAWVPQTVGKIRANVSRALSLVPRTNQVWRSIVDSHYSRGGQFLELVWSRALSRVQVEAVAARTTSALDCFY